MAVSCSSPVPMPTPNPVPIVTIANSSIYWVAPVKNTDGSPLIDLGGFRIYFGTTSGIYNSTHDVPNPSSISLQLNIFLNSPGTYYLSMTAYDIFGLESIKSPEIRVTAQ